MARRKSRHLEQPMDEITMDISSMIDASFLLLIYFIVSNTLEPKESDLGMALPSSSAATASPMQVEPLMIQLNKDGSVGLKDNPNIEPADGPSEMPNLAAELDRYKQLSEATQSEMLVIVSADDDAEQQRFIDVLNTLSNAGVSNISLTGFKE